MNVHDSINKYLEQDKIFVLLESHNCSDKNSNNYFFEEPVEIVCANTFADVEKAFKLIEVYAKEYFLAGFFSYELGYYFENKFFHNIKISSPLIWLGVFKTVHTFKSQKDVIPNQTEKNYSISGLKLGITRSEYRKKITRIKKHIEAGDTYQVNFTTKYKFDFAGNPFSFYQDLKNKQAADYNAFIRYDNTCIMSLSPELYFRISGDKIITKPMKGTYKRGRYNAEDTKYANFLANDEKNRSENLMIVDLMRNDLGRISLTGSVGVSDLFAVEKYNTLFQMTSTVTSQLKPGLTYCDVIRNIFPSGSVTGAPKIRTIQIIHELEAEPRGVYTGAIGFISPKHEAVFNVPIRTITLNKGKGEMGVGSGVVYDSDPDDEYRECRLKANFLVEEFREFSLIETMLFDGGIALIELHLQRLRSSAEYFNFPFAQKQVEAQINSALATLNPNTKYKIRLLLNDRGEVSVESAALKLSEVKKPRVCISAKRTFSQDKFLFHKTTLRELYNSEFEQSTKQGFFDVVFLNEKEQVTEGVISNIFIKKEENYYTPPVDCGLLNGVFRQYFLSRNKNAIEKVLLLKDLLHADKIYLTNAVRGLVEVKLEIN